MTDQERKALLRDPTGSYLHLKLKRFASISDLKMPYAIKSWKAIPHDAEVDISPSARSSCRGCHAKINKGEIRARLWLQCHKGCKVSAYFHERSCFWEYPETAKIESIEELIGLENLPEDAFAQVMNSFLLLKGEEKDQNLTIKRRRLK